MLTIRKIWFLVIIFCLSASVAKPDSGPILGKYGISVTPLYGFIYGQSEEIVYKYTGKNTYLSQLLWDIKPQIYAGLGADFGPVDRFHSNGFISEASIKFGFPINGGIIEDRDWNNSQYNYLTHFSRHDSYLKYTILVDVSAGYSWRLADFFSLGLLGEFSYMTYSWAAQDGYTQYTPGAIAGSEPPWSKNNPKLPMQGEGILYVQNWFILSPGLSLNWKINSYFNLEGNFNYSPLIYCADRDDHLAKHITFYDYSSFGHYFQGRGKLTFSPKNIVDLSLAYNYRYIKGTRGNSYDQHDGGSVFQTSTDGVGVGFSAMDIELSVRIRVYGRN